MNLSDQVRSYGTDGNALYKYLAVDVRTILHRWPSQQIITAGPQFKEVFSIPRALKVCRYCLRDERFLKCNNCILQRISYLKKMCK